MVPKATASSPFSVAAGTGDDEEEKTTIESGWEEEPSTTVEQGDVAERIRALGVERRNGTNVTSTNAGLLDELTVDDQHANAALSMITPPMLQARLLVTGGNDTGQEVAVQVGKTYTIGRAVDNDIVLTDIAVSRKHFDLRHEVGAWVLVDRGSGNGTLVNGNLEDHPFMLANGDAIEIGNTTFRFELPNGPPRAQSSFDISLDEPVDERPANQQHQDDDEEEEEPSTVAGKPIRDELATPSHIPERHRPPPAMPMPQAAAPRAKTMPPPAPMRPRSPSMQGAPMYQQQQQPMAPPPMQMPQPMPASTLPMLQQPMNRGVQAPTMLGDQMGIPLPNMMPTTIPGQGPMGQPQQQMYNPYGQPQQPPQNMAQMLVINGVPPGRDATSTALVPPTPYGGMPMVVPQQPYNAPLIPRRTKLLLAGAGLTLFAAIATVAIIKGSGGGSPGKSDPDKSSTTKKDDPKQDVPKTDTKGVTPPAKTDVKAMVSPAKTDTKVTVQPITPKVEPPKVEPPKVEPPKLATVTPTPKVEPPKIEPPKVEPPKLATVTPPSKVEPPKIEPPKVEPPRKDLKKKEPKKVAKKEPAPKREPTPKKESAPKKEPAPKRVAVAEGAGLRAKADVLYKAKKFTEASNVLKDGAKNASEEDSKDLRLFAGYYASFGKNYNIGMAQGTSAKDAWTALTAAKNFDNSLGGNYTSEINVRMGQVAPKAAVAFMAGKDFLKAKQAVALAEGSGNGNSTTQGVRSSLEQKAGELFKEAQGLQASDPDGAKQKYREIQRMVDPKSPWHQRAGKALSGAS